MYTIKQDNPHVPTMLNVYKNGQHWGTGQRCRDGSVQLPVVDRNGTKLNQQFESVRHYLAYANKYDGFTKQAARTYLGV